ncbi:ABC-type transport system involved in multi-copper enzyme maturation permease subunit [Natranaerovirga pectinivora]|uniref:ABC-type transport system involved in multi-copper enzyme maturation permease subunit n=1 Tax=Natranaerovirga pectinivora TaxID=682400 RepID=A0A4R3MPL6_9FIRM|nr:ABC transporter permease subunit [Natranaerovirga pectinivora]TCT15559.1 ABC-type transport system involved in multi-copper enzyme maturation permease subunit [Natranaerovirga pectinivora]
MINPVFRKELKLTTRSWKFAMMILVYTGVIAAIGLFIFYQILENLAYSSNLQEFTMLYVVLASLQFGLILFVAPALTAGAISGERERQTLEILMSTPLRSSSILIGKLLSSISTITLLVVASTPVLALMFIFGGISIPQLFGLLGYYLVTVIFVGSVGIFVSTAFKRTTVSNVITYAIGLMLVLGTIVYAGIYIYIQSRGVNFTVPSSTPIPLYILYANPLMGFVGLIMDQLGFVGRGSPLDIFFNTTINPRDVWIANVIIELVISGVLLWVASRRLNPKMSKFVGGVRAKKRKKKNVEIE